MTVSKVITSLVAIGMFSIALAQEERRMHVEVISDDGVHDAVVVQIDSDDLDFDLENMQVGENQAVVDESGRTILITREEDGYRFDVEGKEISVPVLHGEHDTMVMVDGHYDVSVDVDVHHEVIDGEHDGEHKVHVIKKVEVTKDL